MYLGQCQLQQKIGQHFKHSSLSGIDWTNLSVRVTDKLSFSLRFNGLFQVNLG